jgi:hypothetical protein
LDTLLDDFAGAATTGQVAKREKSARTDHLTDRRSRTVNGARTRLTAAAVTFVAGIGFSFQSLRRQRFFGPICMS